MMDFDLSRHTVALRDEDGFVRVQPEATSAEGTRDNYEALLHAGVITRPKDPTDGTGANLFVMRQGDDGRVLIGHDPRWMSMLPDFGDGGTALYATTELAGAKKTPFVGFFGEGGAEAEGTFKIEIPTAAGTATIVINATTGDVTITHPGGTVVIVKATGVELGAAGGLALVLAPILEAWSSLVSAGFTALGQSVPALVGSGTTLVKGT